MPRASLDQFRLLGKSGLRVSPLALGTMTFGTEWGFGAEQDEAYKLFMTYVERGGNFIDTANQYNSGASEEMIGKFARGMRDRLVIATKYTLPTRPGDPNSGGNHKKSMVTSVESSLRRLKTDYIDLFYLHAWEGSTPVEEVLRGLDDLVRAGKILYVGISDTPAWQVARMQAIADLRGWSPFIALQMEYSLIERTGERELVPMAREVGLGVIPWSPLAGGVLTGKYLETFGGKRSARISGSPSREPVVKALGLLTDRNAKIAALVQEIAFELECTASQVALGWVISRPGVASVLIGARTTDQLLDNLGCVDVHLTEESCGRLEEASAISLGFPHEFLKVLLNGPFMQNARVVRPG